MSDSVLILEATFQVDLTKSNKPKSVFRGSTFLIIFSRQNNSLNCQHATCLCINIVTLFHKRSHFFNMNYCIFIFAKAFQVKKATLGYKEYGRHYFTLVLFFILVHFCDQNGNLKKMCKLFPAFLFLLLNIFKAYFSDLKAFIKVIKNFDILISYCPLNYSSHGRLEEM